MSRLPFLRQRLPRSLFVKAPAASCTPADVFGDCFTGCAGVLTSPADPAVCGWTVVPGSVVGTPTVSFDTDQMVFNAAGPGESIIVQKSLLIPSPTADFSGQFRFTEFPAGGGDPSVFYAVFLTDAGPGSETMLIFLVADGSVFLSTGAGFGGIIYSGVWASVPGATHTVHWTIDAAKLPSLFVDLVAVPLFPAFPGPFFVGLPADQMLVEAGNNGALASAPFDFDFAATGVLPPTTVFCCPEGGPAT